VSEAQAQSNQEEQSMEEILESIRRIIAEDENGEEVAPQETAKEAPQEAAEDTPEKAEEAGDILELTEVVQEEEASEEQEEEDVAEANDPADDILNNIDAALGSDEAEEDSDAEDSLLSEPAAQAASSMLKDLKKNAAKSTPMESNLPSTRNGTTVEDLMIEAMRPMLKSWLDENLPTIVERIVEREVRKLSD
jgi:hypothetical protein